MKKPVPGFLRTAGICGIFAPIIAFCAITVAISISPWFSWEKNALSDLGASPGSSVVFNSGLAIAGMLATAFSAGLFLGVNNRVGKAAAVLLMIDSLALIGIGVFPETAGEIHLLFSVIFFAIFPLFSLSFLVYSITQEWTKMAVLTLVSAAGAALPWTFRWRGVAIPETISALFASLLTLTLAAILLKRGKVGR
ncbi:MAG: DUF998 domain-containing protein [Candidatus Hadarchaeales archaeon]